MTDNDLNEQVNVTVDDASVITVPIDATLQNSNEAADAKAVGDALALKADKSELQAAVKVNNQPADAQGLILIDGRHIPVSDEDAETLAEAVTDLKGQTAENIPMSSDSGAKTIAEVVNANAEAIESMEEMTGATMPIESGSQTTVKAAIEARVKTVNRKAPDADGDVDLSVVPLAENLQSDKMESVEGAFIIRTTGGNASVSDGKAYPLHLFGAAEHTGYVAEELNMTVIPITRTEPDEPITATIDRDTFVAYVDESSTINLYYTTEWSADPELYGITVTGTPVAGDQITVVYVKEVRGTITVANPARLVGTGWNLFDYNNGYARVVKYSTEYGYKIGGSYASIQFSATLTGERSSITPGVDGLFNVPSDGYVFVTGGNNTDTYILTTWSDWMEGPSSGYWEPYRESGIDLSTVMTTYFPNGLLAVGTTSDEIDLSAKRSISRIERMAYSEENRAAAAASGRSYDFDQNYIYIVRESAVISAITIDTTYNVSEHGLEWFTETTLPVISEILYGKNLRDKLERDVVTISAQTLTEEEKAQVRTNIGAMSQADGDKKLVAPTTAGTNGQLLQTNGDGTTKWTTQGTPTDAQVGTAVSAWLTAHPEATTTVQDGAISRAKLNDDLKAKTDAVPDLKSALNFDEKEHKNLADYVGGAESIAKSITKDEGHKYDNTGAYVTDTYGMASQKIDIPSNAIAVIVNSLRVNNGFSSCTFFDTNGAVVGVKPETTLEVISFTQPIPVGAVKFAVSGTKTNNSSFTVSIKKYKDTGLDSIRTIVENMDTSFGETVSEITLFTNGIAIDVRDGSIYPDQSKWKATDYINVKEYIATQVKLTGETSAVLGVAGYDRNKKFVSAILNTAGMNTNVILTIPENVHYIRASVRNDAASEILIYRTSVKRNDPVNMNHVFVMTTGDDTNGDGSYGKPFASIYKANESITDASMENPYTIHVADGTYTDLQTKYAGTASGEYEGVICKDYVYYEGNIIHPENVVIEWDGSTGFDSATMQLSDAMDKAPFHIAPTNIGNWQSGLHTSIKGFAFKVSNCRYAIHVETSGKGKDVEWEIALCDFRQYTGRPVLVANGNNGNTSMPAIGMGSTCFEKGKIIDCQFPAKPVSGDPCYGFDFGINNHDNALNVANYAYKATFAYLGAKYHFENLDLNGNEIGVRSLANQTYNTNNLIEIIGCNNISRLSHSEGTGIDNHWSAVVLGSDVAVNEFDN